MIFRSLCFFVVLLLSAPAAFAAPQPPAQLSIEELMDVEVFSAAKEYLPLTQTSSAVYVIDEDAIRRSGALHVPELLRMVPGVQVAQINAYTWAVSARGFNGALANKLLVLVDGRSVYTPLYGGVYWDVQDIMLEDIERIEVIRGPGASLWGSNAVNGVVNIITKRAGRTQGFLTSTWAGPEEQGSSLRYGGAFGAGGHYRVHGTFFNVDASDDGNDAWHLGQGGFRADWSPDEANRTMVQGRFYNGEEDLLSRASRQTAPFQPTLLEDQFLAGGHVLGRWRRLFSETSDGTLQAYLDVTQRDQTAFEERRTTFDVEWDHRFQIGSRNQMIYGAGYRVSGDDTEGSFSTAFDPEDRTTHLVQGFVQNTFAVIPEELWVTGGLKAEYNSFTAFEFQPTARAIWSANPRHSFWAAFSRAVRIPSRIERDLTLNLWTAAPTSLTRVQSDSTFDSEVLLAYEAGHRAQVNPRLSVDTAVFYNRYDNSLTTRAASSFTEGGVTVLPLFIDDQAEARTYGVETAANSYIESWWQVRAAYTFLNVQMEHTEQADALNTSEDAEGNSPAHQLYLSSHMVFPRHVELDAAVRYVDALKSIPVGAYWETDLRLAWHPSRDVELSITAKNLLHSRHREFAASGPAFERAFYGQARVRF